MKNNHFMISLHLSCVTKMGCCCLVTFSGYVTFRMMFKCLFMRITELELPVKFLLTFEIFRCLDVMCSSVCFASKHQPNPYSFFEGYWLGLKAPEGKAHKLQRKKSK